VVVEIVKILAVMMDEVAVEPPRLEVKILFAFDKVFGTERFVMVALVAVRFVKKAVMEFNNVVKKFVEVALVFIKLVFTRFVIVALVEIKLVFVKFVFTKLVTVAFVKTGLSVKM